MRFRSVPLLAMGLALAAANIPSGRVALAQIPEAPGTFTNSNGQEDEQSPEGSGRQRRPGTTTPTPSAARDTIDEMDNARARANGLPVPESTPRGLGGTR
jgi:hypothetical protein